MKVLKTGMVMFMCLATFFSLFGCKNAKPTKPTYPFDIDKAYRMTRPGVMAGGSISYDFSEKGIVTFYEYPDYPPEDECGMRDRGAEVYFVGLKPGTVTVTMTEHFPTCEDEATSFILVVDDALRVTMQA